MSPRKARRVILSYGMGVDSTAILLRWLHEPASRGFDLRDLVVITSMTGNEFESTARLVRRHILPRLRKAGVRFVQVARGGLYEAAGAAVLDDSTAPRTLHFGGRYALSSEWKTAATLQTSGGERRCSLKFKGWVIDKVLVERVLAKGERFVHVVGFNADEQRRVDKDQVYGKLTGREARYPLLDWGWGREACEQYIEKIVGEPWQKSACTLCPYSGQGCERKVVIERWRDEPERAAWAIEVERVALAFNPRMKLFKNTGAEELMRRHGIDRAVEIADERLSREPWAVYRLRRAQMPKDERSKLEKQAGRAPRWNREKLGAQKRSIKALTDRTLSRKEARRQLALLAKQRGAAVEDDRAVLRATPAGQYPRIEEYLVAAPAYVGDKHAGFKGSDAEQRYQRFYEEVEAMLAELCNLAKTGRK